MLLKPLKNIPAESRLEEKLAGKTKYHKVDRGEIVQQAIFMKTLTFGLYPVLAPEAAIQGNTQCRQFV